jgi:hypothetical protein
MALPVRPATLEACMQNLSFVRLEFGQIELLRRLLQVTLINSKPPQLAAIRQCGHSWQPSQRISCALLKLVAVFSQVNARAQASTISF